MENLKFLLERYRKGIATTIEKKALLDELSVDENVLREWLQAEFDKVLEADKKLLDDNKSKEIFEKILKNKSREPEKKIHILGRKNLYRWAVAACVGGILCWGLNVVFTGRKTQKENVAVITVTAGIRMPSMRITNKEDIVMVRILEDGTKVSLSPKSSIAYDDFSNTSTRAVVLEGEAKFQVKHDEAHPFSVSANGIVITDLGTVFSVNSFSDNVQVKLFKGKVMIHSSRKELSIKDTYLKPGEQFDLSADGKLSVSDFREVTNMRMTKNKIVKAVSVQPLLPEHTDSLNFNQTLLPEVFDRMSKMYNRQIYYNAKEIEAMPFSGRVNRTDSLLTILKIICNTNDLNFKDSAGNIFIYK